MGKIVKYKLNNAMDYTSYRQMVDRLAEMHKASGTEQSEERIKATELNAQRMRRLEKTTVIDSEIKELLKDFKRKWQWIVITESWCGDAAQNVPIIAKIADCSSNIDLICVLRDENPELMDNYLTNGTRSIPKLICKDVDSGEEIGTWGPRPAAILKRVKDYKINHPDGSHEDFVKQIQLWYGRDKGRSLQDDFKSLLKEWISKSDG